MSIETEFRDALMASAAVTDIVQQRVALNAAPEAWKPPYVVYTTDHSYEPLLTGGAAGDVCTVTAQCWSTSAAQAMQIGDRVIDALTAVGVFPSGRRTGYDAELGLDADVIDFLWVTG